MINEKQKELLQHMLGADERYLKKEWGFRNHYCASSDEKCSEQLEFSEMKLNGLVKSGERFGKKIFWATKKGAEAIGFKNYQLKNAGLI